MIQNPVSHHGPRRMAVQLKGVVQQMDRVNHNIEAMDTKPVNDVAKLWKESYAMSANKKSGEKEDPNSLLAFQNGL